MFIYRELDRQLKERGIDNVSVYCVSPGWCKTSLHRNTDMPWYAYILALPIAALFMKSAKEVSKDLLNDSTIYLKIRIKINHFDILDIIS